MPFFHPEILLAKLKEEKSESLDLSQHRMLEDKEAADKGKINTSGATLLEMLPAGLLATSRGSGIQLWDSKTQKLIGSIDCGSIHIFKVTPKGMLVTISSQNFTSIVSVWDIATQKQIGTTFNCKVRVSSVAALPNDLIALSAGEDVQIWNIATNIQTTTISCGAVTAMTALSNGQLAITSGNDIQLWDIAKSIKIVTLKHESSKIHSLTALPNSSHLAAIVGDKRIVSVWDAVNQKNLGDISSAKNVQAMEALSDGLVVTCAKDSDSSSTYTWIRCWDAIKQNSIASSILISGNVSKFAISADGLIATTADAYSIQLRQYATRALTLVDINEFLQKVHKLVVPAYSFFALKELQPMALVLQNTALNDKDLITLKSCLIFAKSIDLRGINTITRTSLEELYKDMITGKLSYIPILHEVSQDAFKAAQRELTQTQSDKVTTLSEQLNAVKNSLQKQVDFAKSLQILPEEILRLVQENKIAEAVSLLQERPNLSLKGISLLSFADSFTEEQRALFRQRSAWLTLRDFTQALSSTLEEKPSIEVQQTAKGLDKAIEALLVSWQQYNLNNADAKRELNETAIAVLETLTNQWSKTLQAQLEKHYKNEKMWLYEAWQAVTVKVSEEIKDEADKFSKSELESYESFLLDEYSEIKEEETERPAAKPHVLRLLTPDAIAELKQSIVETIKLHWQTHFDDYSLAPQLKINKQAIVLEKWREQKLSADASETLAKEMNQRLKILLRNANRQGATKQHHPLYPIYDYLFRAKEQKRKARMAQGEVIAVDAIEQEVAEQLVQAWCKQPQNEKLEVALGEIASDLPYQDVLKGDLHSEVVQQAVERLLKQFQNGPLDRDSRSNMELVLHNYFLTRKETPEQTKAARAALLLDWKENRLNQTDTNYLTQQLTAEWAKKRAQLQTTIDPFAELLRLREQVGRLSLSEPRGRPSSPVLSASTTPSQLLAQRRPFYAAEIEAPSIPPGGAMVEVNQSSTAQVTAPSAQL